MTAVDLGCLSACEIFQLGILPADLKLALARCAKLHNVAVRQFQQNLAAIDGLDGSLERRRGAHQFLRVRCSAALAFRDS